MSNSFIWPIDWALSGATIPGQSESVRDGNEEVFHIPQSTSITGASPSDCLVWYPGHLLWSGLIHPPRDSQYVLQPLADWAQIIWIYTYKDKLIDKIAKVIIQVLNQIEFSSFCFLILASCKIKKTKWWKFYQMNFSSKWLICFLMSSPVNAIHLSKHFILFYILFMKKMFLVYIFYDCIL